MSAVGKALTGKTLDRDRAGHGVGGGIRRLLSIAAKQELRANVGFYAQLWVLAEMLVRVLILDAEDCLSSVQCLFALLVLFRCMEPFRARSRFPDLRKIRFA